MRSSLFRCSPALLLLLGHLACATAAPPPAPAPAATPSAASVEPVATPSGAPSPTPSAAPAAASSPHDGSIKDLERIHAAMPQDGSVMYLLAHFNSEAGRRDGVYRWLTELSRTPWELGLADADFKLVAAEPRYQELARALNGRVPMDGADFIAVQTMGGSPRLVRIALDAGAGRVTGVKVLASKHPDFELPTTAALAGSEAYVIANSQLRSKDERGQYLPPERLKETVILRVRARCSGRFSLLREAESSGIPRTSLRRARERARFRDQQPHEAL